MKTVTRNAISFFIAFLLLCAITTANPEIIAAHNVYRNEVGVAPLTYSSSLATSAQIWADHDASTGSLVHSSGSYGENIASGMPTGSLSWTDVVNLWGAEKSYFIYGPLGNNCSTTGHWYDVGHYTQIVWSTTTQCGCGKATNVTQNTEYFVCQYSPPGNFWGDYPYPQVVPLPVASFTTNATTGIAPFAVTFTDTSLNAPTTWNWSFRNVAGNNTPVVFSTMQNPVHSFGVGNYSILLNVSNVAGYDLSNQETFIYVNVLAAPNVSKIGITRLGDWLLDSNDNFVWDGAGIDRYIRYGNRPITSGDMSVFGDWNGDGKPEVGIYDGNGNWYLDYNDNGTYEGPVIDRTATFGLAGYKPVVGDWDNTGKDKIGMEKDGFWVIDYNGNYLWDGAVTDRFAALGQAGDIPVVGDWDGTGKDKIGSHKDGFWAIDYNGNYLWDGVGTDRFAGFGQAGDTPVIGDWDGTGTDKIGMEINGFWATDYDGNYLWDGAGIDKFAGFGSTGDTPVVGDWEGNGKTKIGSFKDGFWAIDYNGNYLWDGVLTDRFTGFGQTGYIPVIGKWS